MWKCPDCGREFTRTNQSHTCSEKPVTIDEYISRQPAELHNLLNNVRDAILSVIPSAKERISWGMPTFWDEHNIMHFAAFKNHLGIYPGAEAIKHFENELTEYKTSKGAIQFQYSSPIPLELISKITKWCYDTGNHH